MKSKIISGFRPGKFVVILLVFGLIAFNAFAQELTRLIDIPTAGILQVGEVSFHSSVYKNDGISFGAGVGIVKKFMFGLAYGGEKVLGNEEPNWDEYPGVYIKYRIFDESPKLPALEIGFDSRGYGVFYEKKDSITVDRYEIKSKGFYAVLSENFDLLGDFGVHIGTNYSIEKEDGDDNVNCFIGIDKSLNNQLGFFAEYDFAFNDNEKFGDEETYSFGEKNGYFNVAVYLNISNNLKLQLNFRDLLHNQYEEPDRSLTIKYSAQI